MTINGGAINPSVEWALKEVVDLLTADPPFTGEITLVCSSGGVRHLRSTETHRPPKNAGGA